MRKLTQAQQQSVRVHLEQAFGSDTVRAADNLQFSELTPRDLVGLGARVANAMLLIGPNYSKEAEHAFLQEIPTARERAVFCRAALDQDFLRAAAGMAFQAMTKVAAA